MDKAEEYRLSQYKDLGFLDENKKCRLKLHTLSGFICVEKHVPAGSLEVYKFLAALKSTYIPEIYECIPTEDYVLVIEEYIQGKTLEDMLSCRTFTADEAAGIIMELCRALEPLHGARPPVICRDLKAENVMMDKYGGLKIVDFDIARIYEPGKNRDTRLLGTKEYAAPEQFGFGQTDARTDVYALGVLFNYLVIKKFPQEEVIEGKYRETVLKCTKMDPKERYESADMLFKALCKIKGPAAGNNEAQNAAGRGSFAPPGFRTGKVWKMAVASAGYLLLAYFVFSLELTSGGTPLPGWLLRVEQAILLIFQLVFIGVVFNYRGIKGDFPLLRSKNRAVQLLGCILSEIVLFFISVFLCALADNAFL